MGKDIPQGQLVEIPRGPGGGNMTARRTGGGDEIAFSGETASAALAEQARANVEARFVMARRFPRNYDRARVQLLAACKNPEFAKVAMYFKPVGDGVRGPSIRMAEEIARCMGNIATNAITVYDDQWKRIIHVEATDLEVNLTHPITVSVEKTVERKKLRDGQSARSQRVNSFGDVVYLVDATDDEILNKTAALVSKALRTCILRLAPDSLLSEAMAQVKATLSAEDARDPDAARKAVIDGFAGLGVMPQQLTEYVGHDLQALTPKELNELRALYTTIRDGEATWQEAMELARSRRTDAAGAQPSVATGTAPPPTQPQGKPPSKPNLADAAAQARAARQQRKGGKEPPKGEAADDRIDNLISNPPVDPQAGDDLPPGFGGKGRSPGEDDE